MRSVIPALIAILGTVAPSLGSPSGPGSQALAGRGLATLPLAAGVCLTGDLDTDHDGVPDRQDGCPLDPDKIRAGVCGCGVSDLDHDYDGTPDCLDLCPKDQDKTQPGLCGCGRPDFDADRDGVPDCLDECPYNPEKSKAGVCGCDTPETDTDGDGAPDCADGCPADSHKLAPGFCGCGLSDTDSDGDGMRDCNDLCPQDPAKVIPGQCGCGTSEDACRSGSADTARTIDNTADSNSAANAPVGCGQGAGMLLAASARTAPGPDQRTYRFSPARG